MCVPPCRAAFVALHQQKNKQQTGWLRHIPVMWHVAENDIQDKSYLPGILYPAHFYGNSHGMCWTKTQGHSCSCIVCHSRWNIDIPFPHFTCNSLGTGFIVAIVTGKAWQDQVTMMSSWCIPFPKIICLNKRLAQWENPLLCCNQNGTDDLWMAFRQLKQDVHYTNMYPVALYQATKGKMALNLHPKETEEMRTFSHLCKLTRDDWWSGLSDKLSGPLHNTPAVTD